MNMVEQLLRQARRRYRNRTSKYKPHQGKQECKRRLRQIAFGRLNGRVVSPEARIAAQSMVNWL